MDTSTRKNTSTFWFKSPDISSLKVLSSKVTTLKDKKFIANFGNIIDLLTEKVDYDVITIMAQYYDVHLRCFTFSLSNSERPREAPQPINQRINPFPKLEEGFCLTKLPLALGINPNKLVANWGVKGSVKGLTQKFLEVHAWEMLKEERLDFCSATLAVLIHEIVLFLNVDKFMDHLAVEVFLTKNMVPFLLVDFYHNFHIRYD